MKISKGKLIAVLIGSLTINIISPVVFTNLKDNIVYADTNSKSESDKELNVLQNKFFDISKLLKSDVEFTAAKVDEILKGTNYLKKVGSVGDSEIRYKYENEEIILYSETYKPNNIGGVLYKIYNPNDNVTVLRVSSYNYDEIGWHTSLEVSSESIDSINDLAVKLNTNISKDNLFDDYRSIVDEVNKGCKLDYKKLKDITPSIKDTSKFKKNYYRYYEANSGNNELVVDVNEKTNDLYNMSLSFLDKDESVIEALGTLSINKEDYQALKYYNVPENTKMIHSLSTSKNDLNKLEKLLIDSLN